MCGFAGIVSWDRQYPVARSTLEAMSAAIAHRGPDGVGLYLNREHPPQTGRGAQVGLVHRRLAVLDPSEAGLEPMSDERGRYWVVFNGEIYNFRDLRGELSSHLSSYTWRSQCDTEVLLQAWIRWGERCTDRFNGMFAFAAWDQESESLFIARDRMGQKPLYYAMMPPAGEAPTLLRHGESRTLHAPGAMAFASELQALRAVPWIDWTIDRTALAMYLCWGYIPAPWTIYRGVAKLPPGCRMVAGVAGATITRYFDPNDAPMQQAPVRELAQTARQRIIEAVKRQLVSDVPLGCFLSGGIDSSIIAAAMRASVPRKQPVLTFSIGFDDRRYDETAYAAGVAQHLGTEHRQFIVKPDAAADLPRLAQVFGEPFGDSSALPTHYLSRETRKHVTVALSGDGGDELFCGYDRYRALALAERIYRLPRVLRGLMANRLWQHLPGQHPKSRMLRVKRFLATLGEPPDRRYAGYMRLFDDALLGQLLPEDADTARQAGDWLVGLMRTMLADRPIVRAALALDRITYLPEDLLTKVDRASMLHALEVRSPFMDHELVHFAAGLPTGALVGVGSKPLLRRAFAADLPHEVFIRQKMGFAVPIGQWFRTTLRQMLREHVLAPDGFCAAHLHRPTIERMIEQHQSARVDHTQRLYALLMLELWWRTVHQPSAPPTQA